MITVVIKASAEDHSSWILDETTVSGSHRKTTVREFCMNRSCGSGARPQFVVRASPALGPRLWIWLRPQYVNHNVLVLESRS